MFFNAPFRLSSVFQIDRYVVMFIVDSLTNLGPLGAVDKKLLSRKADLVRFRGEGVLLCPFLLFLRDEILYNKF